MSLEMFENCSGRSRGAGRPTGFGGREEDRSSPSWMLLDSTGQGTILEEDKYDIMRRVQIHSRDLRILDPLLYYPSTILGREGAIVLNLEVLLRDPMDVNVFPVFEELQRRLAPTNANQLQKQEDGKEYSNEHNDVEAGDEDDFLLQEQQNWRPLPMLPLTSSTPNTSCNLDSTYKLESEMTELTGRVQKVRDELQQLLDNNDNMTNLYLTRKLAVTYSSSVSAYGDNDVKELEMLLKAYLMQIYGTLKKLTTA